MNPLTSLQSWLNRRTPSPKPQVRVVDIPAAELTLALWLDHPELVNEAHQLTKAPIFTMMIEVLKNECPANYKMPKGTPPTDLVTHLGEIDGYNMAINNLIALTIPKKPEAELVATFETPEKE